jgi:hypothetical protein
LIARTKTYFTSTDYSKCKGEEIRIRKCDVSNDPSKVKDEKMSIEDQEKCIYKGNKDYDASFIWGQLSAWFKQTVDKPNASLSADRRGTLTVPELESFIIDPKELPKIKKTHQPKGRFAKKNGKKNVDDSSSEDEVILTKSSTRTRNLN